MKFKQIDINCFKSFPDQISFPIDKGLTGIVGPNGCGKSNIVEALKWVMGETSAKSLRGAGMEDVIFNGTSDRPSKNFCEVTLKLDSDGKKSISENLGNIEVRRRLEKDKGSKYFLNGKEVRAKDIHILFADLSTGPHSPSMVSQGRVGNLITAKPTDRRAILEEAAGIGGLHARRHEAELRLTAAENNLNKADDLMKQTEIQLKNLRKQAEEAYRYKFISEDIKKKEAELTFLNYKKIENEINDNSETLNEIEDEISAINIEKNYNLENLKKLENDIKPIRDSLEIQNSKLQKIELEADKISEEEIRTKEKIDNIKSENKN
ncbi:MAG: chromosome segregation protein SMC, partial [Candidatus Pelagibacter sp.]